MNYDEECDRAYEAGYKDGFEEGKNYALRHGLFTGSEPEDIWEEK